MPAVPVIAILTALGADETIDAAADYLTVGDWLVAGDKP
jgi:hypothetical protein